MSEFARRVFTGGESLWKTRHRALDVDVICLREDVGKRMVIHRANVRSTKLCGSWWITSGQEIVQKSVRNDYRPQSTRLLPPITESKPDLQRDVER